MLLFFLAATVPAPPVPDPDLLDHYLTEIAAGNQEALAELYHQTKASVYSFSLSILKNAEDAEDVLHDCYVQIFLAADAYQSLGKPLAWILTIAKNLCRKKLREQKHSADLPEEEWMYSLPAPEQLGTEERLLLQNCLSRLSSEEQQIVILHAGKLLPFCPCLCLPFFPNTTVLSKSCRVILERKVSYEGKRNQPDYTASLCSRHPRCSGFHTLRLPPAGGRGYPPAAKAAR